MCVLCVYMHTCMHTCAPYGSYFRYLGKSRILLFVYMWLTLFTSCHLNKQIIETMEVDDISMDVSLKKLWAKS